MTMYLAYLFSAPMNSSQQAWARADQVWAPLQTQKYNTSYLLSKITNPHKVNQFIRLCQNSHMMHRSFLILRNENKQIYYHIARKKY